MFKLTILLAFVACVAFVAAESESDSVSISATSGMAMASDNNKIFGAWEFGLGGLAAYRYLHPYPIVRSAIVSPIVEPIVEPIVPIAPVAPVVPLLPRAVDLDYSTVGYKADLPFGSYSYGYNTLPTAVRHYY
ncbi:uncharacterized protein LOC123297677 [Chrysoperla carnea]|uniref:uncharacterized protein LOC123297677 n=1 Tax=Chrysoperla carnea TaxID=189513 RepID=UPI001D07C406|nr:uncharacterized protein LOC123297677 [Chrysoperla carnea]